jgi:hypothetical protein
MTSHKDFKRLVRGRMRKTGESYTAARAQLLERGSRRTSPARGTSTTNDAVPPAAARRKAAAAGSGPAKPLALPSARPAKPAKPATSGRRAARSAVETEYARLAGRSESSVKAATGCGWERWVKALDYAGAHGWPHARIARYVHEQFGIPGWWSQSVAVGYERIKGLRAVGQRRDGRYEINRSKTVAVPLARLYAAFHQPALRARWLPGVALTVRSATEGKWMRITWPDGTSVSVGFTAKGEGKSQVALAHEKLPDQAVAAERRQYWGERLEALSGLLGRELDQ